MTRFSEFTATMGDRFLLGAANNFFKVVWFCLGWMLLSIQAYAQTSTYSNTNTAGNGIDDTTTCGVASLTRTFVVPGTDDFTVGDLDVGFLATHAYRGDIRVDLTAPDAGSTTVRIVASNTGAGGGFTNYNVELDDDNTTALNTFPHDSGDGTTAPPYENQVSPSNALSTFNGLNSVGTWTMTICDDFNGIDDGAFLRSDLYFTHQTPSADLDLAISASDTTPDIGTNVVLTYDINNSGPLSADGVSATVTLPAGLSYVSDNGGSAYDDATGVWTLPGSIANGASQSLEITAFVEASGSYATTAEVTTSNITDPDSTPGNANTGEDDYDTLTLVPITPPVPSLLCPGAASVLDWDTQVWGTGSTTNTYTIDGEDITMTVTAPVGVLLNNATFGGQSPAEQTTFTGGYNPVQSNVAILADQVAQADTVDIDFTLGTAGTGVSKFQLTLFDIDFGAAQFEDQITISGSLGGTPVSATYITGTSYTMSGDVATGTVASDSNLGNGNLTIEFSSAVDTVNIAYGNGPGAPAAPGQQGIGIHDIFFCPPNFDYSDAPTTGTSYGDAMHTIVSGIQLGSLIDADAGSLASTNADGDDTDGSDDEDGVALPSLYQGTDDTVIVDVTGAGGFLQGWIDWGNDGSFDAGDQIATDLQDGDGDGLISIPVNVPSNASITQTIARFRWSTTSGLGTTTTADDGEVEDYALTVNEVNTASMTCPAGFAVITQSGNAGTVILDTNNGATALGAPVATGTTATDSNSARNTSTEPNLELQLDELVPAGAPITISLAKNNAAANYNINTSDTGTGYATQVNYTEGSEDNLQRITFLAPAGGVEFLQFSRNGGGSLWIDGISFSHACGQATITATKTTAVYDPLTEGLYAIPGNDVIYTIEFTNTGSTSADSDSIEIIDSMPGEIEFYNGDIDDGGPETNPVIGIDNSSGLSLNYGTDVKISKSLSKPADFASCTNDTLVAGYDPDVTFICLNPSGAMAAGDPDPSFQIQFRARIK